MILGQVTLRWVAPLVALVIVGSGLAACGTGSHTATQSSPALLSWHRRAPAAEGLDPGLSSKIDRAVRSEHRGVTSVLVARHGALVIERYYGIRPGDRWPVFSVTKTVVSALVGIALAEGWLRTVDESVSEVIPQADRRIRIRDLLSMTAGYGRELNFGPTDATALAGRPLVNPPGQTFLYDSGSFDLLAEILFRITGTTAADYARRRLFGPMGVRGIRWPGSHGGSGLLLRPRELLAFGQMYLDGGWWKGRRVVPAAWVRTSTRAHVTVPSDQGVAGGYGYGWWVEAHRPRYFAAHGYLGQVLAVFPGLDEVIVVTADGSDIHTLGLVGLIRRATHGPSGG